LPNDGHTAFYYAKEKGLTDICNIMKDCHFKSLNLSLFHYVFLCKTVNELREHNGNDLRVVGLATLLSTSADGILTDYVTLNRDENSTNDAREFISNTLNDVSIPITDDNYNTIVDSVAEKAHEIVDNLAQAVLFKKGMLDGIDF
jgi:uncharacterized protein YozE (UPF0346 family)